MGKRVRLLKTDIKDDNNWKDIITSISCDTFLTALSGFIDIEHKVVHLDLHNDRKAVILCIEKRTLMAVCDKAQSITDKDFINIFDEVFYSEDEIPSRHNFIEILRKVSSDGDPITLEYML